MRPNTIDIDLATEDTDAYANNADTDDGAAVTLLVNEALDGLAHKIVVTPSGSVSGNFTLVGTDADGKAQSETLATDTTNAVTSTNYFKTLTSFTNATVGAETIDIGWADEASSITYPIDRLSEVACSIMVDVTGTINFTVQEMWDNVHDKAAPQLGPWINISALASKTADTSSTASRGATAIRIIINSYSAAAELQMYTNQPSRLVVGC